VSGERGGVSALGETVGRREGGLLLVDESVMGGEGGSFSRSASIGE